MLATRATAGEETLFRGIHKLMPGHVLTMADGHVQQRRYWDVPSAPEPAATAARAEDVEAFRALLDESVRLRLMSDVPLGVFLSGGIDSSAIAGLMARPSGGCRRSRSRSRIAPATSWNTRAKSPRRSAPRTTRRSSASATSSAPCPA